MQETFRNMNSWKVNYNTSELFALRYCASWFGLRLDWTGELLVAATFLAIVFTRIWSYDSLDIGFAALALSIIYYL
jgi:hypothetical protein